MNPTKYTFGTYVTTQSNRFARLAAEAICNSSEVIYNPFYIYGPSGVGKTHLLHAIAEKYENTGRTSACLSAHQFCEELIVAIRNGTVAEFKEKYCQVEVLLLDGLEYIAGKEATQEELYYIVEKRYLNCKQTVFSGDAHPTQIPVLNTNLSAYLTLGLCVEIPTPDFEGKAEIISRKLKKRGVDWPAEVCRYVALNTFSGVNQIEGEINRIIACKELFDNT